MSYKGSFRPTTLLAVVAAELLLVACGPELSSQSELRLGAVDRNLEGSSNAGAGRWEPTAPLAQARYYHTATLVAGGQVLVVGGGLPDGRVWTQAELYDSSNGTWGPAASPSLPRIGHSATLLRDGRVLIVGGWDGGNYLISAQLYDPSAGTWAITGSLQQERHYHTATVLSDGKVLVAGGWNDSGVIASAELYDPSTGRWTATGSLTRARDSHTATVLPDGKVLVTGGWGTRSYLSSAELYDPATGTWADAQPLAFARGYHTATLLAGGKVLVAGGYNGSASPASTELYDPASGQWTTLSPLGEARYYHTETLLPNGQVFIAGGYGAASTPIASAELYDPATNQWSLSMPLAEARSNHTATLLPSGLVLAAGGLGGSPLASSALYVASGVGGTLETSINSAPPPYTSSTSATFTFSSNNASATFECGLDGAVFSVCTSPSTFQNLAAGAHTFRVRARDAAGNVDPTPAWHSWTVDRTPPDTTLGTKPPANSSSNTAEFTFSSNDASATFECSLDGAPYITCTSPTTYRGLPEGSHTFRVRARDTVGNVDPSPASYTWTVDLTTPDTLLNSTPPAVSRANSAEFTFSSNETSASFTCSLDGAAFTACSSPKVLSGLTEGSHTFRVRARDAAGNVDPSPASYTWTVDLTSPDTRLTSMPPPSSNLPTASFTFTSDDGGASFACSLDGAPFTACNSPSTLTGLAEGSHTFKVRAQDAVGNIDPTPASYTWIVDQLPPDTLLTSTPPARSNSTSAQFTFSASEAGATFECSLDGAPFSACTSPASLVNLAASAHTFQVRARDTVGNIDATPASYTWTVDLTAPGTTLDSASTADSAEPAATFTFSSNEPGSTFECSLDGVNFQACTSPARLTDLAEGEHTFQVRARDAAGNVDATPASHTWTLHASATLPKVVFPAADASLDDPQPTISGTAPPGSMVSISLNGTVMGTVQASSSGHWHFTLPSPLPDGEHTVAVSVSHDTQGSSTSEVMRFTIATATGPSSGVAGCTAGVGSPSLALAWLALVVASARRRRSRSL